MSKPTHVLFHKHDKEITHLITVKNECMIGYMKVGSLAGWYREKENQRPIAQLTDIYSILEMSKLLRVIYE